MRNELHEMLENEKNVLQRWLDDYEEALGRTPDPASRENAQAQIEKLKRWLAENEEHLAMWED